jgi:tol-pal system protein YbgF
MIKKSLSAFALLAFMAGSVLAEGVPTLQTEDSSLPGQGVSGQQNQAAPSQVNTTPSPTSSSKDGLTDLFFMVQQLQDQVQQLTGKVQEQAFEIKQLKSQGLSRYRDLDSRILSIQNQVNSSSNSVNASSSLPSVTVAPSVTPAVGTPAAVSAPAANSAAPASTADVTASKAIPPVQNTVTDSKPSDEQMRDYNAAFANIRNKDFDKAVDDFHNFINKYPKSVLAGNAYYWLGEVYLVKSKLEQAKEAFTIVAASFPNHRKAPDALFKLGVTYQRMGDNAKAKSYLQQVIQKYPDSSASRLASEYLKKL